MWFMVTILVNEFSVSIINGLHYTFRKNSELFEWFFLTLVYRMRYADACTCTARHCKRKAALSRSFKKLQCQMHVGGARTIRLASYMFHYVIIPAYSRILGSFVRLKMGLGIARGSVTFWNLVRPASKSHLQFRNFRKLMCFKCNT